ncbi:MAG: hypothetical protein K9K75_01665 [Deltaproteobacteria bacterium]|nr:hypothetical protein [Deltaproteobacteria bacterium]
MKKAMRADNLHDTNWQPPTFVTDPIQKGSKAAGMESQWNNLVDESVGIAEFTPWLLKETYDAQGQPAGVVPASREDFALFDVNGAGVITQGDIDPTTGLSVFDVLRVWTDDNENGVREDSETNSLRECDRIFACCSKSLSFRAKREIFFLAATFYGEDKNGHRGRFLTSVRNDKASACNDKASDRNEKSSAWEEKSSVRKDKNKSGVYRLVA